MSLDLVPIPSGKLGRAGFESLPAAIARAGEKAAWRFIEFFTANIRNKNTRAAYAQAVREFFSWCEARGFHQLDHIQPVVIAAYIEQHPGSPPTVKQHLAAIRMLFDWLVTGQIVPVNPAGSLRGPKHVVNHGKTPVLKADQARTLAVSGVGSYTCRDGTHWMQLAPTPPTVPNVLPIQVFGQTPDTLGLSSTRSAIWLPSAVLPWRVFPVAPESNQIPSCPLFDAVLFCTKLFWDPESADKLTEFNLIPSTGLFATTLPEIKVPVRKPTNNTPVWPFPNGAPAA